jgi:hypothetical protein
MCKLGELLETLLKNLKPYNVAGNGKRERFKSLRHGAISSQASQE